MKKRAAIAVLAVLCGALSLISAVLTAVYVFRDAFGPAILQLVGFMLTTAGMLLGFEWTVIFEAEKGGRNAE